ncbi:MAG: 1-acyl-sn-glycerol-3-phosphate acyltransferase [Clostridiales bacterium]|nr:1-acyl-sn-glycerol-3-phosphate acyltransferase [Clostridiales bacterium]
MNFFHKTALFCFNLVYPYKIFGKENIPEGGALFVCNHFSAIDCGFVADAYSKDVYFLAKKELFKNKFIGGIIKSFGAIPIDREKADVKAMVSAIKVLKEGHKLVVFPEGTRNKTGTSELQEIKGGSAVFAVKAKCPIVPMMLLKKARPFSVTKLIIGEPFYLDEFYNKKITPEVVEEMDKIVATKMKEQHAILKELTARKKKKALKESQK